MTPDMKLAHAALEAAKAKRREVQKRVDGELSMSNDARKSAAAAHLRLDLARISSLTPATAHVRAARIHNATIDAEAMDHEVTRAEGYVARVKAELSAAVQTVDAAIDDIVFLRAIAAANRINAAAATIEQDDDTLRQLQLIAKRKLTSPDIERALESGRRLAPDDIHTPINQLLYGRRPSDSLANLRAELARDDADEQVAA